MQCAKCGNSLKNTDKFCKKCGSKVEEGFIPPMDKDPSFSNQQNEIESSFTENSSPSKPPKKKTGILVFAIIAVLFIGGVLASNYLANQKIYELYIDYDEMRDADAADLIAETNIESDGESARVKLDINSLNAYIEEIDLWKSVDVPYFEVRDMCFDPDDEYLYMLLKNQDGRHCDAVCNYELYMENQSIMIDVFPLKAGNATQRVSDNYFKNLDIDTIQVPLDASVLNDGFIRLLNGWDLDIDRIDIRSNNLVLNIELEQKSTSADSNIQIDYEDTWTIMIYMNGSNLEYDEKTNTYAASGSEDIDEMLRGLTSDKVNLIIETGGTLAWYRDDINPNTNQRFIIENSQFNHLMDVGKKNMCDAETLISFANYGISQYPADNYALLLWDHGGGALAGFGYDMHFPADTLYLPEIEYALDEITSTNNIKLELFGFDACLMATVETAAMAQPYSNYFIASEEMEPSHGWDYTSIMGVLSDESVTSGDVFGRKIVSGFVEQSVSKDTIEYITLSTVDLSKIDEVVLAMDNLTNAIMNDIESNSVNYSNIAAIIPKLFHFSDTDHYDLEGFAKEMIQYYPALSNELLYALDDAVISNAAGSYTSSVGGLSFYLPFYYPEEFNYYNDIYEEIQISNTYTEFAKMMMANKVEASDDNIEPIYSINFNVDPYEITIDPDYYDNYLSNIYINAWELYISDTEEIMYDLGYDAWVEATDTPYVFREMFSAWPHMMDNALSLVVIYHDDDHIIYESPIVINDYDADMRFTYFFETDSYTIDGFTYYSNDESNKDYTLYAFNEGDRITFCYSSYDVINDEEFYACSDEYVITAENYIIQDMVLASGNYALQFAIEDYNGEMFYTEYSTFSLE